MKQYVFEIKIVGKAKWIVKAETLADAERRLQALREDGEPPVGEDVEDSEIIAVLEDGVLVPPPGKKRCHVEVEAESGNKHYEVFASDEDAAQEEGVGLFFEDNADQDFLTVSVEEVSPGEAEEVQKAWHFHVDVIGYGEDPTQAWDNLLLYALKQPPPCERIPDHDVRPENKNG